MKNALLCIFPHALRNKNLVRYVKDKTHKFTVSGKWAEYYITQHSTMVITSPKCSHIIVTEAIPITIVSSGFHSGVKLNKLS
jgi:hypothetical protein